MKTSHVIGLAAIVGGIALYSTARAGASLVANITDISYQLPTSIRVKVAITNPTRTPINLTGITGTVRIANVTGNVAFAEQTRIPNGTTEIWLPVNVSPVELIGLLSVTLPINLVTDLIVTTPTLQVPVKETRRVV